MSVPRIVAGRGSIVPVSGGAIAALAFRLRDHARARGLAIVSLELSRIKCSRSRYLTVADARGRRWTVRVSNHHMPNRTGHLEPQLDFVSLDGVSGFDLAADYLSRVARGEIAHREPHRRPRRKGVK